MATKNMKKRRQRIRSLLPSLSEEQVIEYANIVNPIVRIGTMVLYAHENGLPVGDLYEYRKVTQRCNPEEIADAKREMARLAELKACESNYRQITILRFGLHGILHDLSDDQARLDDKKHRPTYSDPLLRGAGRATGHTAKAVRRGTSYTNWQMEK